MKWSKSYLIKCKLCKSPDAQFVAVDEVPAVATDAPVQAAEVAPFVVNVTALAAPERIFEV